MPSGKRAKAARHAPPPPVRPATGRPQRQASPRVLAIAAGVVVLIAAIVAAVVVLTGGSKKSSVGPLAARGSLVNALPGAQDVDREFKGIPQVGLRLGSPAAPVTLALYVDLQCPFCQHFETQVMPSLVDKYVRTGKVKVEERPLAFIGSDSIRGRNALIAAAEQNRAFNFAQLLYFNQGTENTGWLSDALVARAAESIPGVDPRALVAAGGTKATAAAAKRFDVLAAEDKVKGTPTVLVGKTGTRGKEVALKNPTDASSVIAAIQAALAA